MGFEINRFVDKVNKEFICGICKGVLQDPVMVKQCQHFFCWQCIQNQMKSLTICPKDSNVISFSRLIEPQKLIINLLNDLKIKCDFASNGCPEVVSLGQLDRHKRYCAHNPSGAQPMQCICSEKFTKREFDRHKQNCLPFVKREVLIHRSQISTFMADIYSKCSQEVSDKRFNSETEYLYHKLCQTLPKRTRDQSSIQNILLYLIWQLLNLKPKHKNRFHIQSALRDLIQATASNAAALRVFNRLDGLEYIILTRSLTVSRDINQKIIIFLVNFTEFEIPLKKLMERQCLDMLFSLLDPLVNGIEISFNCVEVLSEMIIKFRDNWNELSTTSERQLILNRIKGAVNGWRLNARLRQYSTFKKQMNRLKENFDSMPPEVQYKYVWLLVHYSRDEPKKYVPMIETEDIIPVLRALSEKDSTESYLKDFIQLLLHQIETFKSLGHLNGLEKSDKRNVIKI